MLTRLEVRGFKNLLDVSVDFGAFTCIVGENGIGKSNVFDAIQFLSFLANASFGEAAAQVRGAKNGRGHDPRDLFWDGYGDHDRRLSLAAEMLVPLSVEDDLGTRTTATTTFLRYELDLAYEGSVSTTSPGRIRLLKEELRHIKKGDAPHHLKFPHSVRDFRGTVIQGERRGGPFLSTETRDGVRVVNVHGDGGSRGRPQPRDAERAGRTVLSTATTNDNPTVLAARREMQSWRRLALEPSALRSPDDFSAPRVLGEDGSHLAAALYRIAEDAGGDSAAVYAAVANRLADLTGLKVRTIDVVPDQVREVFTLFLTEADGLRLPARALSEGTLRFLALCVLLQDPSSTGLICMEEPENGIHPANLEAMLDLVRDLAVDPAFSPGKDNPFRQVIVNTHSPALVQLSDPDDLLLAEVHSHVQTDRVARALELRAFKDSWRARQGMATFAHTEVVTYLTEPPGAQLTLPLSWKAS